MDHHDHQPFILDASGKMTPDMARERERQEKENATAPRIVLVSRFKAGDVVHLPGWEMPLVVRCVESDGSGRIAVVVQWFDVAAHLQVGMFPEDMLRKCGRVRQDDDDEDDEDDFDDSDLDDDDDF